jgi:hypothetical protein
MFTFPLESTTTFAHENFATYKSRENPSIFHSLNLGDGFGHKNSRARKDSSWPLQ